MSARLSILQAIDASLHGATIDELATQLATTPEAVTRVLEELEDAGLARAVRVAGPDPESPIERFVLVEHPMRAESRFIGLMIAALAETDGPTLGTTVELALAAGRLMTTDRFPDDVVAAMADLGFVPRETTSANDEREHLIRITLARCPLRQAVSAPGGHALCAIHAAFVAGACRALDATLVAFTPRDPYEAGCAFLMRAGRTGKKTAAPGIVTGLGALPPHGE